MAENMQDLKRRMKSIQSTEHITNAMRLVSASKFRKAKSVYDKTNFQLGEIEAIMEKIFSSSKGLPKPYMTRGSGASAKKATYILISSSKGLCGGFNAALMRLMKETLEQNMCAKECLEIYAIGSRGLEHFERLGYPIIGRWLESPEKITFSDAQRIAKPILERFEKGETEAVYIVYTSYINSLCQEAVVKQLLPRKAVNSELASEGMTDLEDLEKPEDEEQSDEIEFLPGFKEVIEYMMPKYFELVLFKAVIESAVCEHAARRSAMENATDNANDMLDSLELKYNVARQQAITDELIEIVAGAEALR